MGLSLQNMATYSLDFQRSIRSKGTFCEKLSYLNVKNENLGSVEN